MKRRLFVSLGVAAAICFVALHELAPAPVRPAAFATFGRGSDIVLVHGLGSTSEHWLATVRVLSRDHRVTLVDLPGHGESEMPQPFSLDQAVTALDEALAARGSEPVVLVGHSLGGLVCAAEAAAHPARVRALVLIETALRPQVPLDRRAELMRDLDEHYTDLVHAAYLDFGRDSTQGEVLWREVAGLDPAMIKRWIRLAWTADLTDAAAGLSVPVLVVLAPRSWGDNETWADVSKALGYDRVPHVRAERLTGCGHFVMLDRPGELARLIADFAAHPETNELRAAR
jgi:pimeloyl-ACP methyl ester carboxylesterase